MEVQNLAPEAIPPGQEYSMTNNFVLDPHSQATIAVGMHLPRERIFLTLLPVINVKKL